MHKTPYEKSLEAKVKKGKEVFIAGNASVLGEVSLGHNVSIWYQAIIRGDSDRITIGSRTNIQDGVILHVDPGAPVELGNGVVVGHGAIVHGARVERNTLIGIRATVLNHARIGKNCIIGAHALVTGGTEIPDNSLVMGTPGKVIRKLHQEEIDSITANAQRYVDRGLRYLGKKGSN